MSIRTNRDAECPGKAKVSELEDSVAVDEQVLRLEVAVENATAVAIEKAIKKLAAVALE